MQDMKKEMRLMLGYIIEKSRNNCKVKKILFFSRNKDCDEFYANEVLQESHFMLEVHDKKLELGIKPDIENFFTKILYESKPDSNGTLSLGPDFDTIIKKFSVRLSASSTHCENYHFKGGSTNKTINNDSSESGGSTKIKKDASVQTTRTSVTTDQQCQCDLVRVEGRMFISSDDITKKEKRLNELATKNCEDRSTALHSKTNSRIRLGLSKRFKPHSLHNKL